MKHKILSVIIIALALILGNIKFSNYTPKTILINEVFPSQIGEWTSQEIIPDKSVYDVLEKEELLFRKYTNALTGKQVVLSIVISDRREDIHGPSVCYQGQGIEFQKESVIDLNEENKINYVIGSKNQKKLQILYWFTDLEKTFTNSLKFSMSIRKRNFWNKPLKGMGLVVINTPYGEEDVILDFANKVNSILHEDSISK